MKASSLLVVVWSVVFLCVPAYAATFNNLGACFNESTEMSVYIAFEENVTYNAPKILVLHETCKDVDIIFTEPVNLTFGDIQPGEIVVTPTSVFIDSTLRPDLDVPATIIFRRLRYVTEPVLLRDGVLCAGECTNKTFTPGYYSVDVSGFSNYSLQYKQDFTLYSDDEPYIESKVYQSVDLGDAYRGDEFACTVQIYAESTKGDMVLVRTDPERKAFNLVVDQDKNLPESLGYFPIKGGIGNVYFRDTKIYGYNQYTYLLECVSNTTSLYYEEALDTVYQRAGRKMTGRAIWFASGSNAFYISVYVIGGIFVFWFGLMIYRRMIR